MEKKPVFILTGPTGSGKSARALEIATERNGVIINADAMQTYKDLHVLSARPAEEETARAPHAMYGVLDVFDPCTAARWIAMATEEIRKAWAANRLPMLVGGTGMYLKSLMQGLADVPEIPSEIRSRVRALEAPYDYLQSIDPAMASRLKPGDSQRIARAIEVMESTGASLAEWQEKPLTPPLPEADFTMEIVELPREELYARIDRRLDMMMKTGALEEARVLWEKVHRRFPSSSPPPILPLPRRGRAGVGALQERRYPLSTTLTHARDLRRNMTDAEQLLWRKLRGEQLGVKFRKQHPLGHYIADFACLQPKLIIELDGGQHTDARQIKHDEIRTRFFEEQGFRVLRFWNDEALRNVAAVLEEIYRSIHTDMAAPCPPCPHPGPPPAGEGDGTSPAGGEDGSGAGHSPAALFPVTRELSATYPLLRAHGAPEFFAYFDGRMALEEAIDKTKQNTRNYAKRQMTWIRNQFAAGH